MLGYGGRFEEGAKTVGENPHSFASRCWAIKAEFSLPDSPELYNQQRVTLRSRILGCQIAVNCETNSICVEVGESVLAALESFLATSALDRAIACEPELTMEVRVSDFAEDAVSVTVAERRGQPHLTVKCRAFDLKNISIDEQGSLREGVFNVAITALAQFVMFRDYRHDLETLFRDERVHDRAGAFTSTFGTQTNVLGISSKTRLSAWKEENAKPYPLVRTEPWMPEVVENHGEEREPVALDHSAQRGSLPPELLDRNLLSHEDIETVSLIRGRLWNRAQWGGVGFLVDPDNQSPPVLALLFSDREAGQEIFVHWREDLGKADVKERMRLAIVRGIDKAHPHAYRVIVGSALSVLPRKGRFVSFVSRIHRMDATTSENLERFLAAYAAFGGFFVAPGHFPRQLGATQDLEVDFGLTIAIRHVHVRNAWEIGLQDLDSQGICEDDDPVIPKDIDEAPVLELMKSMREHR